MARKRDLDPALWENEDLAAVPREARLLFIACISQADDDGRLKGSARYLRSKAFPYDEDVSASDVETWRDQLVERGPLCVYSVDGEQYVHLPNWHRWQSINRRVPSRIPPCPQHSLAHGNHQLTEGSVSTHAQRSEDSLTTATATAAGTVTESVTGTAPLPEPLDAAAPPADSLSVPVELQGFHAALAQLPGFSPSTAWYSKVLQFAAFDLDAEALKIVDWLQSRPRQQCSPRFVLSWLQRAARDAPEPRPQHAGVPPHRRNGSLSGQDRRELPVGIKL